MNIKKLENLNSKNKSKYIKKSKSILLKSAFHEQITNGNMSYSYGNLRGNSELNRYYLFDPSIITTAIDQLKYENKIHVTINDSSNLLFSLTNETFNKLNQNRHPILNWFFRHIFDILNFIIALLGAITGTLALFFK